MGKLVSDYIRQLKKDQSAFMEELVTNVTLGGDAHFKSVKDQIKAMVLEDKVQLLSEYRGGNGDSVLHTAALFNEDERLLKVLSKVCSDLINLPRKGRFEGQTALHVVVSKMNKKGAQALLQNARGAVKEEMLTARATGKLFEKTVLMGELPLTTAALTLWPEMVDQLLSEGAPLHAKNSRGETVLHSLVRFAGQHPEKSRDVLAMIDHLHKPLDTRPSQRLSLMTHYKPLQSDPLALWFTENAEGLTALKLCASLGVPEIFFELLTRDGVYRHLDEHDGVFDVHLFDITEIDPVAQRKWLIHQTKGSKKVGASQVQPMTPTEKIVSPSDVQMKRDLESNRESSRSALRNKDSHRPRPRAVMDIICRLKAPKAFLFIDNTVVHDILEEKWQRYRCFFYIWLVFHLAFMSCLTAFAIYRARISASGKPTADLGNNSTKMNMPSPGSSEDEVLVESISYVNLAVAGVFLLQEVVRSARFPGSWLHHHSQQSALFRATLVAIALCLILDFVINRLDPEFNFFLILALIMGWWFSTFFLRVFNKFAFFTVMFQQVLLGDMLRFSVFIFFQLLSFSVAMHLLFLISDPVPDDFRHLGVSLMTMFKLMLGLTEFEILYEARQAWLSVSLFVVFVLMTYVLLINSLIAMMSQTCALVSEHRDLQWKLQTLSVVHMIESLLPNQWASLSGQRKTVLRYDFDMRRQVEEERYFRPVKSLQVKYTDSHAIYRRKDVFRTHGFGELTMQSREGLGTLRQPGKENKEVPPEKNPVASSPPAIYHRRHAKETRSVKQQTEHGGVDKVRPLSRSLPSEALHQQTDQTQIQSLTNPFQNQTSANPAQNQSSTNTDQSQSSTNPVQAQSSTNPVQTQSSTNPVQTQSSTNPVQAQSSTNPAQNQTSTNPGHVLHFITLPNDGSAVVIHTNQQNQQSMAPDFGIAPAAFHVTGISQNEIYNLPQNTSLACLSQQTQSTNQITSASNQQHQQPNSGNPTVGQGHPIVSSSNAPGKLDGKSTNYLSVGLGVHPSRTTHPPNSRNVHFALPQTTSHPQPNYQEGQYIDQKPRPSPSPRVWFRDLDINNEDL